MKNGMNEHAFKKVEREETNAIIDFWLLIQIQKKLWH